MTWIFPSISGEQVQAESHADEFFGGDRKVEADSFIREVVQNAMDASASRGYEEGGIDASGGMLPAPVQVNFRRVRCDAAESDRIKSELLGDGFLNHLLRSKESHSNPQERAERVAEIRELFTQPVELLVVEDLETTGLCGPIDASGKLESSRKNDLTCFLRLHGQSGKHQGSLGTFGVGRTVLYMASQMTTFFVLTMPEQSSRVVAVPGGGKEHQIEDIDSEHIFFGMSLQKCWTEYPQEAGGETRRYDNYCTYLDLEADTILSDVHPPYTESGGGIDVVEAGRLLGCQARNGDTGLSTAILYPQESLGEDELRKAFISQYSLPVLRGHLASRIGSTDIDLDSILDVVHDLEDDKLTNEVKFQRDYLLAGNSPFDLDFDIGYDWRDEHCVDLINRCDESILKAAAGKLQDGGLVRCRIGLDVRMEGRDDLKGQSFEIAFKDAPSGLKGRRRRYRGNLWVREARRSRFDSECNMLTIVDSRSPLGVLMGDSEGPAHVRWQHATIKSVCPDARRLIEMLSKTMGGDLYSILKSSLDEPDYSIFADLLPSTDPGRRGRGRGGGVGDEPPQPPPPPPPPPPRRPTFALDFPGDGRWMQVTRGADQKLRVKDVVEVVFAYDTIKGNPQKLWVASDFDLQDFDPAEFELTGAEIVGRSGCRLTVRVTNADRFKVRVATGRFDADLDLLVDCRMGGG